MTANALKTELNASVELLRSEIRASTEVSRSEMGASAEVLRSEMRQMRSEVDQRFEQVDQRFEQVDHRFDRVDQRFDQVNQRFVTLERNLNLTMAQLRIDIASDTLRAIQSVEESYRARTSAVDDKYRDLPERVTTLEEAASLKR